MLIKNIFFGQKYFTQYEKYDSLKSDAINQTIINDNDKANYSPNNAHNNASKTPTLMGGILQSKSELQQLDTTAEILDRIHCRRSDMYAPNLMSQLRK